MIKIKQEIYYSHIGETILCYKKNWVPKGFTELNIIGSKCLKLLLHRGWSRKLYFEAISATMRSRNIFLKEEIIFKTGQYKQGTCTDLQGVSHFLTPLSVPWKPPNGLSPLFPASFSPFPPANPSLSLPEMSPPPFSFPSFLPSIYLGELQPSYMMPDTGPSCMVPTKRPSCSMGKLWGTSALHAISSFPLPGSLHILTVLCFLKSSSTTNQPTVHFILPTSSIVLICYSHTLIFSTMWTQSGLHHYLPFYLHHYPVRQVSLRVHDWLIVTQQDSMAK